MFFCKTQQHHGGKTDVVFAYNFNYFVEMLLKVLLIVSVLLKKLGTKLHETLIYISVSELSS
jgi:hypothetical protein